MTNLLPCPFCGESDDIKLQGSDDDWFWQCQTCTTTGPNGVDEDSATLQWNTRHDVPSIH